MVILGALIAVLVVLGLCLAGWQIYRNVSGTGSGSPTATGAPNTAPQQTAGHPSATQTGKLVSTFCEDAKGRPYSRVERGLKQDGFQVNRQDVPGPDNLVVEITPCRAVKGTVITVKVGNGQPAGGGGPGGPGTPTCALGIGGGLGGCPSATSPSKQG